MVLSSDCVVAARNLGMPVFLHMTDDCEPRYRLLLIACGFRLVSLIVREYNHICTLSPSPVRYGALLLIQVHAIYGMIVHIHSGV